MMHTEQIEARSEFDERGQTQTAPRAIMEELMTVNGGLRLKRFERGRGRAR